MAATRHLPPARLNDGLVPLCQKSRRVASESLRYKSSRLTMPITGGVQLYRQSSFSVNGLSVYVRGIAGPAILNSGMSRSSQREMRAFDCSAEIFCFRLPTREGSPAAGGVDGRGSSRLGAGAGRAEWSGCSADVELAGAVLGELAVRQHALGHTELLEYGEELFGCKPFLVRLGLPDGHHVEAALVRAGRPGEQAVDVLRRVVLGGDRAEVLDGDALRLGDVDECHDLSCLSLICARFALAGR